MNGTLRKIAEFLLIPVIVGALISLDPNDKDIIVEQKIIIFGLVVFLWALAFPSLRGTLPRDAADFWYYTFAAIGIIFFFITDTQDRERIRISNQHNSSLSALAEFRDHQRPLVETFLKDPNVLLANMKQIAEGHFKSASNEKVKALCAELPNKLDEKKRVAREQTLSEIRQTLALKLPDDCGILLRKQVYEKLTHVQSLEELMEILLKNPGDLRTEMGINQWQLQRIIDQDSYFNKYFKPFSEGQQIKNILDREERSLEAQVADTEKANWAMIGTMPDAQGLGRRNFKLYFWPYFVLTALGLKLARVKYFSI